MTLWRVMFLAEKYGRMTMTLDEVAEQIGIAPATIRTRRSRDSDFQWLKTDGRALYADVADVAAYLEQRRTDREDSPA
jgi:CO/xanthine dehydrogenase Mo-binding subunit